MKHFRFLLISVLAGSFLWATASSAQEEDRNSQARELFEHGIKLYDQGEPRTAAEAFREAYRLRPSYKILFNIGQAEASSGRYGLAMEAFQQYLVKGKDEIPVERRDYVSDELRRLEPLVGEVQVESPDNSTIYIDGIRRGTTPLMAPVMVVAGEQHEAVVVHENVQLINRKFSVWGGKSITLEPEKKTIEKPEKEISPASPEPEHEEDIQDSEKLDQTYFWIGLGATAAFGAVTIGMTVLADQKIDEVKDDPDNDSLKDEGDTVQKTGIAFLALTGAAAVATAVLAVFTDFEFEDQGNADVAVAPWIDDSSGGIGLRGRF